MTIPTDDELLRQIDAFLERSGMSPTRFGLDATGEGGLIKSIRDGRSITLRNGRRIIEFMNAYDSDVGRGSPNKTSENCPPSESEAA